MKTLKFREYKSLNENLNQGFLEPTRENIMSFGLVYSKVKHNPDGSIDYDGHVNLSDKALTQIPFRFNYVSGNFKCESNNLSNFLGSPETLGGNFWADNNNATTLQGSPKKVKCHFSCHHNNLTTLRWSPETVGGNFWCYHNNIIILDDYNRNFQFKALDGNPIVINKTDFEYQPDWPDQEIRLRFKNGIPYIWNEIENQEDFGKILEKIIELEILMDYPEEVLSLADKFNLNLIEYVGENGIKALKIKATTIGDIGWGF